ncbi:energy-coupling factor transporter transmembrane component T family protein [Desulfosediminicola sp.]|uniref:energy-coupling factor transporter transmembrane component T family protein n=1 Tax=Desulfosediminicola sp. TaxID=2886825 RepID=UPI003AF221A7
MKNLSVNVRSKLALFFLVIVFSMIFNSPFFLSGLLLCTLLIGMVCSVDMKKVAAILLPLLPIFILLGISSGFFSVARFTDQANNGVLFCLGDSVCATRGGFLLGVSFLCRLTLMILSTSILLQTTSLDDFIDFFNTTGLPPSVSFVITTAIRFVPELNRKKEQIINAQRARGVDMETGQWLRGLKARISIMIPLIIQGISLAEHLSIALLNRGFGCRNNWTVMKKAKLVMFDYFILLACLLLFFVGVVIRSRSSYFLL